ncbi:dephospho-CoA kinase, partial [Streptomyces niveus]|uniref:dephospho-CoA kinase n=1 Tax=Streptomyces niveus TaxID=193462 RepID=UPI003F4E1A46
AVDLPEKRLGLVAPVGGLDAPQVDAGAVPGLDAVVDAFGPGVLTADGRLDRPKLGALVFADDDKRATLNAIVHPLVRARSVELESAAGEEDIVVHDVPLLVESELTGLYDMVVVVDASPGTQLDRLVRLRGMAESEARSRMAAQATRERRTAAADLVIDNDGPLEKLEPQVRAVWERLVERAAADG